MITTKTIHTDTRAQDLPVADVANLCLTAMRTEHPNALVAVGTPLGEELPEWLPASGLPSQAVVNADTKEHIGTANLWPAAELFFYCIMVLDRTLKFPK